MVFIKSPKLFPRESKTIGESFVIAINSSNTAPDFINIGVIVYQSPILEPNYFGKILFTSIQKGETGQTVGNRLVFPQVIPVFGVQTSIVASVIKAESIRTNEDPNLVKFINNKTLAWINPRAEDIPPKAIVSPPTVEPQALIQNGLGRFYFKVSLSSFLKEEDGAVTVPYEITQYGVPQQITAGALTFNSGETVKTVEYYPQPSVIDGRKRNVYFRVKGANGGQYPYSPLPAVGQILPSLRVETPTAVEVYVEDGTRAQFKIELNAPAEFPITVKFKLEGTAQAGVDYFPPGKTFAFPAEQQIVTLDIKLKKTEANFDRSLTLKLISADSKGEAGEITGLPTGAGVVIKKAVEV